MEKKYKVFYQGSLYGHFGRDRAGKEIEIKKAFFGEAKAGSCRLSMFAARGLLRTFSKV